MDEKSEIDETPEYQMKLADSTDAEIVIGFHNKIHNDNRELEQWKWEYETTHPNNYVFSIMLDGDRIIGSQGMIPIYLNIKNQKILTGKSENSILDPEYRGGTKFQDLYEFAMDNCAKKGMALIWGFTPAVKVWRNKLNFLVDPDCMFESISITNMSSAISNFKNTDWPTKRKLALSIAAIISSVNSFFRYHSKGVKGDGIIIEPKMRDNSDIKTLFARLKEKSPNLIFIEPTAEYLAWRLKDNPNNDYITLFLYKGSELRGYCYFYLDKEKKSGEITDITYLDEETGTILLKRILAEARQHKIGYISFYGNVKNQLISSVFDLQKRLGFIKKKHMNAFVLRNIAFEDEKHISAVENWYMNGLWTEGF